MTNDISLQISFAMSVKQNILDFFDRKFISIATTIVYFLRVFGLTYGGLSIGPNGKLCQKSWVKVYGYLITIVYFVIFLLDSLMTFYNNDHMRKFFISAGLAEDNLNIYIVIVRGTAKSWQIFQWFYLFYFNK